MIMNLFNAFSERLVLCRADELPATCDALTVKDEAIENFKKTVGENYKKKIGYDATFYTVEIGGGPEVI